MFTGTGALHETLIVVLVLVTTIPVGVAGATVQM